MAQHRREIVRPEPVIRQSETGSLSDSGTQRSEPIAAPADRFGRTVSQLRACPLQTQRTLMYQSHGLLLQAHRPLAQKGRTAAEHLFRPLGQPAAKRVEQGLELGHLVFQIDGDSRRSLE